VTALAVLLREFLTWRAVVCSAFGARRQIWCGFVHAYTDSSFLLRVYANRHHMSPLASVHSRKCFSSVFFVANKLLQAGPYLIVAFYPGIDCRSPQYSTLLSVVVAVLMFTFAAGTRTHAKPPVIFSMRCVVCSAAICIFLLLWNKQNHIVIAKRRPMDTFSSRFGPLFESCMCVSPLLRVFLIDNV
jgi:hypothetical protein